MVQGADRPVGLEAEGLLGDLREPAADEVAERVAAERIARKEKHVHAHHDAAHTDPERLLARDGICEPERVPRVVSQEEDESDRDIQEVAMDVLKDQRERALTEIGLSRLANSAIGWIRPERLVVRAPVVVAAEAEPDRCPENQECR
jgi:hypothetical protein